MKLLIFVGILQVQKFEFLKFRILEILNFHPCSNIYTQIYCRYMLKNITLTLNFTERIYPRCTNARWMGCLCNVIRDDSTRKICFKEVQLEVSSHWRGTQNQKWKVKGKFKVPHFCQFDKQRRQTVQIRNYSTPFSNLIRSLHHLPCLKQYLDQMCNIW